MKQLFNDYYNLYSHLLEDEVMPFWMRHSQDKSGAINNCLAEDGRLLSRDRYIWSQGRALWTFSRLYNRDKKRQDYLSRATGLFEYLSNTGPREDGSWNYLYDGDGNVKEESISIYVDGFVMAGMTEYYKATGNPVARKIALDIFDSTRARIHSPGSYKVAPYIIPDGMITHGVNMIFSFFYTELARATGLEEIRAEGYRLAIEVLEKFYIKEKDAILEFVTTGGDFSDTPQGRACVPGHAIECMWFLINIFEEYGDTERIATCCRLIKRHIELGLDKNGQGMMLALDIDGKEPIFWGKPTYKPWWVQVETLVATAYAYKHTRDGYFLDIHKQICDYALSHYPSGDGEWHNWLDRDGQVGESAALPVKDPFHLPRGLMFLCDLFGKELPKIL